MKPDKVIQAIKTSNPMDWVIKFSKLSEKFAKAKKRWKTKKLALERRIAELETRLNRHTSTELNRAKRAEATLRDELTARAQNDTRLKEALAKAQKDLKEGRGTKAEVEANINLARIAWEDRLND